MYIYIYSKSHECARVIFARARRFRLFVSFCSKLHDEMEPFNSILVPNKDFLPERTKFALLLNIFIFSSPPHLLNILLLALMF
jgi:hypothetical protein